MSYYTKNYKDYIDKTINVDMKEQYNFFQKYLKNNSSILDVGFGSGRDMIYFSNKGFDVFGIDIEQNFINHAKKCGLNVEYGDVLNYQNNNKYDGIWCCASLLHLKFNEILIAIKNLKNLLNKDGIIYMSFKYGDFEGYIDDRYYCYLNEDKIKLLNLNIIDQFITYDSMNRGNKWINLIIK